MKSTQNLPMLDSVSGPMPILKRTQSQLLDPIPENRVGSQPDSSASLMNNQIALTETQRLQKVKEYNKQRSNYDAEII